MVYSQEVLTSTLSRMYGCDHTVMHRTIRATTVAELLLQEAMLNRIISDLEVGPRPDFCLCVPYHDGTSLECSMRVRVETPLDATKRHQMPLVFSGV